MDKSVYKYVEYELYNYYNTKQQLSELRDDILFTSPCGIVEYNNNSEISDSTGNKAVKLVSSPAIHHMERIIRAVDSALNKLDDIHKQVFELKYHKNFPPIKVYTSLYLPSATYYRINKDIVKMVAFELGLINYSEL